MPSAQSYYEDSSQHGNYQYESLKNIVDGLLFAAEDDDNYLKNTRRSRIVDACKRGIKELNKSVASDVLAVEVTIGTDLKLVLPQDYVNWVRVSLVTDDYKLVPLNVNYNMSIATGYLQDNEYQILFDNDGEILTADASNAYNKPFQIFEFETSGFGKGDYTTDASQFSAYGQFNIDERRGCMVFSSNLSGREVVIEYISDGLQWQLIDETDITVHKHIVEAVREFAIWQLVENRRSVPDNYKERKRRRYKTLKHQAAKDRAGLKLIEINRVMRSKHKWI